MMSGRKPITAKALKTVISDYLPSFIGWEYQESVGFSRQQGPVRQSVWFEVLQNSTYRPVCGVSAICNKHIRMIPQVLDFKNRESSLSNHNDRFAFINEAILSQFIPDVRSSIDIDILLNYCVINSRNNSNDLAFNSILCFYQGHVERALSYCRSAQSLALASDFAWERNMHSFFRDLETSIIQSDIEWVITDHTKNN